MLRLMILFASISMLPGCDNKSDSSETETASGIVWGDGIVSEDPPGADDWDDADTDTNADTHDKDPMTESYSDCSNEMPLWVEPDPLARPCNFQLLDQNGNYVELYDFEGDVILLDFSTMWCSVCKRVAEHVQTMHDQYDPFSVITVLTQDTSGDPPTVDQLEEWVDEYGIITAPVLAGNDMMIGADPDEWNVTAMPTFFLIDKNFHLRIFQPGWNEETMTTRIEDLIAE